MNPRGQPIKGQGVPGGSNNSHRLIRRGMPYGPAYVPGTPDDGTERGLLGYIINSSIENQFEFLMREWLNGFDFVGASRLNPKAQDVMTSRKSDPAEGVFEIPPNEAPPLRVAGFSCFVTTRASAYCFLPSVTALKFIAGLNYERQTLPHTQCGSELSLPSSVGAKSPMHSLRYAEGKPLEPIDTRRTGRITGNTEVSTSVGGIHWELLARQAKSVPKLCQTMPKIHRY